MKSNPSSSVASGALKATLSPFPAVAYKQANIRESKYEMLNITKEIFVQKKTIVLQPKVVFLIGGLNFAICPSLFKKLDVMSSFPILPAAHEYDVYHYI